ncbi:MAG: peroxiredoxin [Terriglobia bacterium]
MSGESDFTNYPADIPVPVDDGACDHLPGAAVPSIPLLSTSGKWIDLSSQSAFRAVVFCYPMTGVPGKPLPPNWNMTPGARGCTPETCSFRDRHAEFGELGAEVFGLSSQTTEHQQEVAGRLHVPFEVLSDSELRFATALCLPLLEIAGMKLIRRLTLVIQRARIEKVFYPVFPPDQAAAMVLEWLRSKPLTTTL